MEPAQLKATLKAGKPVFGFMIAAIEGLRWARVYAGSTLDYIIIDWEHSSRNRQQIAQIVTSVQSAGITCIVRTPNTDDTYVAMALDAGADGVLVPYCETVEEVRACANKVRLHPLKGEYFERACLTGELPSEKTREYLHNRHKDHIFIMGIESEPCGQPVGRVARVRRDRRHLRRSQRPHNIPRHPRRSRQPQIPRSLTKRH